MSAEHDQDPKIEHATHLEKVTDYYDVAQRFYYLAWHRESFGLHYGLWTSGISNRFNAIENENKVLAELAGVKKGDLVLDAGCGVGGSGLWLSQNTGARVVGINITESQLRKGQRIMAQKGAETSAFAAADYHILPFADSIFDVFWSLESIEHSDDLPSFVYEAKRALKPGGRAVIAGTFLGERAPNDEQIEQMETGKRAAGAFNDFRSADEVVSLMRENGFHNVLNINATSLVMPSAETMESMCRLGLPLAKIANEIPVVNKHLVPDIMVDNTAWGTYQADLFREGVTSYHIIMAQKES